jgi:hypothetical protein
VKGLALTVALLALPASAGAQVLTLNCQYESSSDPKTNIERPMSGAFSAIVHMKEPETEGGARIEATTSGCFNYVGAFNEQEVIVRCERVIERRPLNQSHQWRVLACFSRQPRVPGRVVHALHRPLHPSEEVVLTRAAGLIKPSQPNRSAQAPRPEC